MCPFFRYGAGCWKTKIQSGLVLDDDAETEVGEADVRGIGPGASRPIAMGISPRFEMKTCTFKVIPYSKEIAYENSLIRLSSSVEATRSSQAIAGQRLSGSPIWPQLDGINTHFPYSCNAFSRPFAKAERPLLMPCLNIHISAGKPNGM